MEPIVLPAQHFPVAFPGTWQLSQDVMILKQEASDIAAFLLVLKLTLLHIMLIKCMADVPGKSDRALLEQSIDPSPRRGSGASGARTNFPAKFHASAQLEFPKWGPTDLCSSAGNGHKFLEMR